MRIMCFIGGNIALQHVSLMCDMHASVYVVQYMQQLTFGSGGDPQSNPTATESLVTTTSSGRRGKPNSLSVITLLPLEKRQQTLLSNITALAERAMLYIP